MGAVDRLTLEQARAHARRSVAEFAQSGLPAIAKRKSASCSLGFYLDNHYEPWARAELKGGGQYTQTIRAAFEGLLSRQLATIDGPSIDRWWQSQLVNTKGAHGRPVAKASLSRYLAALRSSLSKAVEWKLLDKNPLFWLRNKTVESKKVVRFLSGSEESRLRDALAYRDSAMITGRASANKWRSKWGLALLTPLSEGCLGDPLTPVVLLAMNTVLRRGELLSLRWNDIDMDSRMLTVRAENAKSGKRGYVPLNVEAVAIVSRWRAQSSIH